MNKSIGIIIKYYRKMKKMSQAQLSNGICVPSYLSKIENCEVLPTEELLSDLEERLDIRIQEDFSQTQYELCDQAIDALMNLNEEKARELYNKLDMNLSATDHSLKYLTLKYKFTEAPDLADILEHALTHLEDSQVHPMGLILYGVTKENALLLDRYFSYSGYGYYLKACDMNGEKAYKKALQLFKESELHYLSEGYLRGMLYAIKSQGLVYASMKAYDKAETIFIRISKMLQETGETVFAHEKYQNSYNLNYIKYILKKPNHMKDLLEENIRKGHFEDATLHHTLITIYCGTDQDKALAVIEKALILFSDENSFDHRQILMEKRKITDPTYVSSDAYCSDLKWLIEQLKDNHSHLEYHARQLELIGYLKLKRRYKEALDLTESLHDK